MDPKITKFWTNFGMILGSILGRKTAPKGDQKWDPKMDPRMIPEWSPKSIEAGDQDAPKVAHSQGLGSFLLSLAPLNDH